MIFDGGFRRVLFSLVVLTFGPLPRIEPCAWYSLLQLSSGTQSRHYGGQHKSSTPNIIPPQVSQIPRDPWQSSRKGSVSRSATVFPTQSTPHPCLGYSSRVLDQDPPQMPTSFSPQKRQQIHRRLSNHRPGVARSSESMESVHSWSRPVPETSAYSFKFV